ELRNARVVDTRLQLGIRVRGRVRLLLADHRRRRGQRDGLLLRRRGTVVSALDAVVEAHYEPVRPRNRRLSLAAAATGRSDFAISRSARPKSDFGSESTA